MHHDSYFTLRSENPSLYPPARAAPSSSPSSAQFFDPNFNVPTSPPRRTRLPRSSSLLQAPPPPPPSHFKPTFLRSPKSPQTWAHVVNHDHREDPTVVTRPGDHLNPDQGQYNHHLSPFDTQIAPSYRPSSSGNRSYVDRWSSSTNSSPDTAPDAAAPPSQASGVDNTTIVPAATSPPTSAFPVQQKYQHQKTSSASPIPLAKFATSPDLSQKGADYFGSAGRPYQHRTSFSVSASARLAQDQKFDSRGGLSPAGAAREFDSTQSPHQVALALTTTEMPPLERTSSHDEVNQPRVPHGHSRSRSSNRSVDLSKPKAPKPPSQKAMLSRALQKANNAVQLDNNQDFKGARHAYAEACDLLHQVLQRTSADEDKRKLDAIRRTYTSRITELDQMLSLWHEGDDKSLPAYPVEEEDDDPEGYRRTIVHHTPEMEEDVTIVETATLRRIGRDDQQPPQIDVDIPITVPRKENNSRKPPLIDTQASYPPEPGFLQSAFNRTPVRSRFPDHVMSTAAPTASHVPQHVSSAAVQPTSGTFGDGIDGPIRTDFAIDSETKPQYRRGADHTRDNSQSSWLDPIDESGGSAASSVHSRTSSLGFRRRHLRARSGDTEAEFDTALDAAIEAAYDDGYEPMDDDDINAEVPDEEVVANALRKVELARERVRQTEREAYEVASEQERQHLLLLQHQHPDHFGRHHPTPGTEGFFDDNSSDEEERMLEEITKGFAAQEAAAQAQTKPSSVPRESDSSGITSNTGHSSVGSNALTGNTALSTVTESMPAPFIAPGPAPAPPPTGALPELPFERSATGGDAPNANRRQSTQNYKQLKIETKRLSPPHLGTVNESATSHTKSSSVDKESRSAEPGRPTTASGRRPPSALSDISPTDPRPLRSPFGSRPAANGEDNAAPLSPTTNPESVPSASLRGPKGRNMSISNLDESETSPGTPLGSHWGSNSRAPAVPLIPTPLAASLRDRAEGAAGGLYLLDDYFHSFDTPGSPNPLVDQGPVQLEPCPTDFMLRPFWLMRCLYQTLVHPRGGYLSSKLFIPREAWGTKGVKLKNIEDKVANCDFLTAALLKLAKVDTFDADALLEEMQSMENILEQIQIALGRKLGNEVGIHGAGGLFRDGNGGGDGDSGTNMPRSSSVSGKSSFSWRRLRPKNSSSALGNSYHANRSTGTEAGKDSIPTLPMTAQPTSHPPPRNMSMTQFTGPNANYMGSLARLFDAAQVIDQIARQVEDPGLRHADKTQVGLELSARHAAEFFAFYICRFVLSDLGILMDKFIKRGTEWVLA